MCDFFFFGENGLLLRRDAWARCPFLWWLPTLRADTRGLPPPPPYHYHRVYSGWIGRLKTALLIGVATMKNSPDRSGRADLDVRHFQNA